MDRLFDIFVGWNGIEGRYPDMDMYQTDELVVVKATPPGIKPEKIQIYVTGDMLTIRGEKKQEEEVKNATFHLREQRFGSFSRSIPLPSQVISDKAKAVYENGVLTLEMPKAEEVRSKTITVKAR
jgi:HSP20 family protein